MSTRAIPIPKGATIGAPEAIPIPKGAMIGDAGDMTPQDMLAAANRQFAQQGLPAASAPSNSARVQPRPESAAQIGYEAIDKPILGAVGNVLKGINQSGWETAHNLGDFVLGDKTRPAFDRFVAREEGATAPEPGLAGTAGRMLEQGLELAAAGPEEKGGALLARFAPKASRLAPALGRILGASAAGATSASLHNASPIAGAAGMGGMQTLGELTPLVANPLWNAAERQYREFFGNNGGKLNAIRNKVVPELLNRRVTTKSAQDLADYAGENFGRLGDRIDELVDDAMEKENRPNLSLKALPPPKESVPIPASPNPPSVTAIPAQRVTTIQPIKPPLAALPAHPITLEVPGREPVYLQHPIAHTPGMILHPSPSSGPVNVEYLTETGRPVRSSRGRFEPGGVVFHVPPTGPVPKDARTIEGDLRSIGFEPHTEFTSGPTPHPSDFDRPSAYQGGLVTTGPRVEMQGLNGTGETIPRTPGSPSPQAEPQVEPKPNARSFGGRNAPPRRVGTTGGRILDVPSEPPLERPLVDMRPVQQALADMRGSYLTRGTAASTTAQSALGNLEREIALTHELGDFLPLRDARQLRQQLDEPLGHRGAFYQPPEEQSRMAQQLTKANSLRHQIGETVPDIKPLNKEANFWANVGEVAGKRAEKAAPQGRGLGRAVVYPMAALIGLAQGSVMPMAREIGGAALLDSLNSPAWRTASAVAKAELSDAAKSGALRALATKIARATAIGNNVVTRK